MLAALAVLSLALGNLVAIVQTNLKRMLAYSTIAHVGFILLGFLAGGPQGVESALFYTLVYVIMTAGAFGILILMSAGGVEAEELDDLKGLNRRSPWFAADDAADHGEHDRRAAAGGLLRQVVGPVRAAGCRAHLARGRRRSFSVIGAFYYLRVIRLMYFDEGGGNAALQPALDLRVLLSVNGLLVLGLGLFPGRLLELCARALT